jgi:hypothetical protein
VQPAVAGPRRRGGGGGGAVARWRRGGGAVAAALATALQRPARAVGIGTVLCASQQACWERTGVVGARSKISWAAAGCLASLPPAGCCCWLPLSGRAACTVPTGLPHTLTLS